MTSTHEPMTAFLKKIKTCVGNPAVRVPKGGTWRIEKESDGRYLVTVELTVDQVARNMQGDVPSSPMFALCLAYWHEKATRIPTRCRVIVSGPPPEEGQPLLHWRRSQLILGELRAILPSRFACELPAEWRWPKSPVINKELGVREERDVSTGGEHALEVAIMKPGAFLSSMREVCPDFKAFERQMPIGLFEGKPRKAAHWTPGGKSQVDLWGTTRDGQALHLLELKDKGNKKVGIVSEAFYYARLLHYVRVGVPGVGKIEGRGVGLDAARVAKSIVMWLAAPDYHPLVYSDGKSPIEWLNDALVADNMEFRILRISSDKTRFIK